MRLAVVLAGVVATSVAVSAGQQAQQPNFRAGVEVIPVDVGVVDGSGRPMANLGPSDFTVRVGGQPRRVVSAEWVPLGAGSDNRQAESAPEGFTTNDAALGGRLIVVAIDQPNIRFGSATLITRAVAGFIDKLTPADRVAVVGFGQGAPVTPFLSDFQKAKDTVALMNGGRRGISSKYSISLTEGLGIVHSVPGVLGSVIRRECESVRSNRNAFNLCEADVSNEGQELGRQTELQARETIQGLTSLFSGLRLLEAPKTVLLVSEGFATEDPDGIATDLGGMAAAARASLYVLHLDDDVFDLGNGRRPTTPTADRRLRAQGIETLAAAAGGDVFKVVAASEPIFSRIESELSGYYLLGVESDPRDADGKTRPISVDVARGGALVRAHRQFLDARSATGGSRPQQAVTAALNSPLPVSALPVRVATFSLQGAERGKVRLLVHADIGGEYRGARSATVGYAIVDATGRTVESKVATADLTPAIAGVPGALEFLAAASVAPGNYRLKLVAIEGGRAGTVEHAVHAAIADATGVGLSDLMVGATAALDPFTPSVGYVVSSGKVHGYVEAYGPQTRSISVTYELAGDADGATLQSADIKGHLVAEDRIIFSELMPVTDLPPGPYVLRARVFASGQPVTTLTRAFEVRPAPVSSGR